MSDFQKQIKQAKDQRDRAVDDLKTWESFGPTTITNETSGKITDLRAEVIARCQQNIDLYNRIIAALESKAR